MKSLGVALAFVVVAVASYSLGRRYASTPAASSAVITVVTEKTSSPRAARVSGGNTVVAPEGRAMPFGQNLTAAQRGYEAASADLDATLQQIESLPVSERMGFVAGVFSFVARNFSPAEALKIQQKAPEAQRNNALRALVGEWIYSRSPLDEDMRYLKRESVFTIGGGRLGLEVELSNMLASAKPDAELIGAWLDAFSHHGARAEILTSLAGQLPKDNPEALLKRVAEWTPWEKERATRGFLWDWASEKPQEAWDWYQSQRGRFDSDLSSSILSPWAAADPKALAGVMTSLTDPAQRQTAIGVIGKALAMKNTNAAVDWADGFADAKERELAHRAVYDGAPRGIGAVLDSKNGFPTLRGIVPGSPLEGTGVKPGDQFIEVRLADGTAQPLYGKELGAAADLIRGEPGTLVTLRVLRQTPSQTLEELFIPVRRGQLYLDEKLIPPPPVAQ